MTVPGLYFLCAINRHGSMRLGKGTVQMGTVKSLLKLGGLKGRYVQIL